MTPYYDHAGITIYHGDALTTLADLPAHSVQCCVTSPPYYGLRDYKCNGQLGLEPMPEMYVAAMVAIFAEVRRVLKDDGVLWLNLGDSYAGSMGNGTRAQTNVNLTAEHFTPFQNVTGKVLGLKPKDLVGIPWRVAFALQVDGWWLRSDIIWAKQNCMPESVTDRPTRSHEYIFLLTKSAKYYYDADAIKEPALYDVDGTGTAARKARQVDENKSMPTAERAGIRPSKLTGGAYNQPGQEPHSNARLKDTRNFNGKNGDKQRGHSRRHAGFNDRWDLMTKEEQCTGYRNKRDVWTVAPAQFPDAHFATFPPKLIEPCILAGSQTGDTILDPFHGAGTTAMVSKEFSRKYIGIDLNQEYIELSLKRLSQEVLPL